MRTVTLKLSDESRAVLARSTITADSVTLPEQLERKLYLEIDKVFKTAGGKWNRGRKAHIFAHDPREVLGIAVVEGAIVDTKKTLQQFWTPPELVARMVRLAKIPAGARVLEPSAGTGNILRAIVDAEAQRKEGPAPYVVAVEVDRTMADAIPKYLASYVFAENFLALAFDLTARFDRILMNPPFHGGQDVAHILHARGFLKPKGRLVAICADGPREHEALFHLCSSWSELPAGTFRESGTDVRAVLLTIEGEQ